MPRTVRASAQPAVMLNVSVHSLQGGQRLMAYTLWFTVDFLLVMFQDIEEHFLS